MPIAEEATSTNAETVVVGNASTPSSELKSLLERRHGVRFTILDGETGDVRHAAPEQPSRDWGRCAEMCREVARRGRPEFIDEEEPLLALALPLTDPTGNSTVAVATFLTRNVEPTEDLAQHAKLLGMRPNDLLAWARRQTPWTAEVMERVNNLVFETARVRRRAKELERQVDNLSSSLASTCEEIGLLYRLIQDLKLSKNDDDNLGRQALKWIEEVVFTLTSAIDAKDPYTCGHSDRVAQVAVRLAKEIGCDNKTRNTLYLAGLLHDIGKIGIDDSVLQKPGTLSREEYAYIQEHVNIGHRLLNELVKIEGVLPAVLYHHESWDGGGYPHQLDCQRIPLSARIVAVADAFDAMSSDRPYRKRMPDEQVDEILSAGAGQQWDPDVIEAYLRVRDDIRHICGGHERPTEPEAAEQA